MKHVRVLDGLTATEIMLLMDNRSGLIEAVKSVRERANDRLADCDYSLIDYSTLSGAKVLVEKFRAKHRVNGEWSLESLEFATSPE